MPLRASAHTKLEPEPTSRQKTSLLSTSLFILSEKIYQGAVHLIRALSKKEMTVFLVAQQLRARDLFGNHPRIVRVHKRVFGSGQHQRRMLDSWQTIIGVVLHHCAEL